MAIVLESLVKIVFMFLLIMGMVPALIWAERKGAAYIQDRTGPNRASIAGVRLAGLVHPIADVLKLVFKEDIAPTNRHRALYSLAPWLVMTIAVSTYAVIPFGDYLEVGGKRFPLVVADLQVGLLYVLAVASLGTYGVVLGGWAANNKFTFLGGIRATAQMISYEISMGLAIMGLMLVFGTLRLTDIVAGQGGLLFGFLPMWGVVLQPLGFVLFITAVYAETNRNPFDLPEGESEIVAGYHLEYSSLRFALFFMAEYAAMIVGSAVTATLFFGGYSVPFLTGEAIRQNADLIVMILGVGGAVSLPVAAVLAWRRRNIRFYQALPPGDARLTEPKFWAVVWLGAAAAHAGLAALGGLHLVSSVAIGPEIVAFLLQVTSLAVKVLLGTFFMIWIRWTLPRFRYDQVMNLGWRYMLPLALANVLVAGLWIALTQHG